MTRNKRVPFGCGFPSCTGVRLGILSIYHVVTKKIKLRKRKQEKKVREKKESKGKVRDSVLFSISRYLQVRAPSFFNSNQEEAG